MTTIFTCTEPADAWSLVSHFLGNQLLAIGLASEVLEKESGTEREINEAIIYRSSAQLIGNLYMLVRRMRMHGHHDAAAKIQQILDMVTDQDVTRAEVRQAIHDKNEELNARAREFQSAMAKLRAEGAFRS